MRIPAVAAILQVSVSHMRRLAFKLARYREDNNAEELKRLQDGLRAADTQFRDEAAAGQRDWLEESRKRGVQLDAETLARLQTPVPIEVWKEEEEEELQSAVALPRELEQLQFYAVVCNSVLGWLKQGKCRDCGEAEQAQQQMAAAPEAPGGDGSELSASAPAEEDGGELEEKEDDVMPAPASPSGSWRVEEEEQGPNRCTP